MNSDDLPEFDPPAWLEQHLLAHWLFDLETRRILWANEAACRRYGYRLDELLALTRDDLMQPEEIARADAFVAALPASLAQQPVWRERLRDGEERRADWRGVSVRFRGRAARLLTVADAEQRERATHEANRSRELLQVAGRMAHIGGWSLDVASGRTHWSDEVCALHEMPPGSASPLPSALDFYPGAAADEVACAVQRCVADGTPMDLELPFVGARGTRRWVRVVGEAVRGADGRVVAVQGAQQDITESKAAALALAESRERLRTLIAAIPDLWMVYDADFRYEQVSDPAHPGLSAPWADKLGRRVHETVDAALADAVVRLSRRAQASGQPQSHHYALKVTDGRMRWFEARYVAMSGGRTLALIRDVTETREAEERFGRMADAAPIAIFIANAAGDPTYANPAWLRLFGLDAGAAGATQRWPEALHPDDLPRVVQAWRAHVDGGTPFEQEFRLRPLDGGPLRYCWAQVRPMREDAEGASRSHVGLVVDMTPLRELQQERQARAVAEEAGQRQQAFLSRVSHELRTPLNAILGFGELLRAEPGVEAIGGGYLGHLLGAARHMLALVDDLLELQRIDQGLLAPAHEPVDTRALLASCAHMLEPLAAREGITLELDAPAPPSLASDERALRQVLLNLASNAVKYGRRGGRVRLGCAAAVDGRVVFTVADDGPGMTPEQLDRLFRPFERLGRDATPVRGSGLGLVISRHIAEQLGGTLTLASRPGEGTTATLALQPGLEAGPPQPDRGAGEGLDD